MKQKKTNSKTIETLTHDEAKRKNIPTAEFQSVLQKEAQEPLKIKYPCNVNGLDEEKANLNSDIFRPFDKPGSGRIAVKVINHLDDEVMKVFKVW